MPKFGIVNRGDVIQLGNNWVDSPDFKSKNRIVNAEGKTVVADCNGHKYEIISKKERSYSGLERFGRGLLGCLAIAGSLGLAYFSNSVWNLIVKKKETRRFGVLVPAAAKKLDLIKPTDGHLPAPNENPSVSSASNQKLQAVSHGVSQVFEKTVETPPPVEPIKDEKPIYKKPKILFGGAQIEGQIEINIALIEKEGKERLVSVKATTPGYNWINEYEDFEEKPLELLYKIAQDNSSMLKGTWAGRHYGSPLSFLLNHSANDWIKKEELVEFLLGKDTSGYPRYFSLSDASLVDFLKMLQKDQIKIDLKEKDAKGETLFIRYAGHGYAWMIKLLLEIDPSAIEQVKACSKSPLVQAIVKGRNEKAEILLAAMEAKKIPFSDEELWIKRVYKNDCSFTKEEFLALSKELKKKIYLIANTFRHVELVVKLKALGMAEQPDFEPGPAILACNMDFITARNSLVNYLKDIRKRGQLLTESEFNALDKKLYRNKGNQLGRILGTDFMEKIAKENHLKYVKAPKKIAVISKNCDSLSFDITDRLEPEPKSEQLKVYAQNITPVKRLLSYEEAVEFMIMLEKSGFNDFFGDNIFIAADGIYIIDTEYTNFTPDNPCFDFIKSISNSVAPEDQEKFLQEYEKRKANFLKEALAKSQEDAQITNLAEGYRKLPIQIQMSEVF